MTCNRDSRALKSLARATGKWLAGATGGPFATPGAVHSPRLSQTLGCAAKKAEPTPAPGRMKPLRHDHESPLRTEGNDTGGRGPDDAGRTRRNEAAGRVGIHQPRATGTCPMTASSVNRITPPMANRRDPARALHASSKSVRMPATSGCSTTPRSVTMDVDQRRRRDVEHRVPGLRTLGDACAHRPPRAARRGRATRSRCPRRGPWPCPRSRKAPPP